MESATASQDLAAESAISRVALITAITMEFVIMVTANVKEDGLD